MTFYIILAISCFMISLIGTRLLILTLRRRTVLIDIPNLRSNHYVPTPKGGGLAVMTALIIALLVADIDYVVVLSMLLLVAISLFDDLIGAPVFVRFAVQILAVALPLNAIQTPILGDWLPLWLDKCLVGVAWLWFINLFNFMDGIDGLSATEMASIGAGLCLPAILIGTFPDDPLSVYALLAATAATGFLWWNWHPAKIFLGDVGSIPIGFFLGYLLVLTVQQGHIYAALILPAYYLSDGTITLLRRIKNGQKIWQAHSEHYYQRAVRAGRRHDSVTRFVFGVNLQLIFLATMSILNPEIAYFTLAIAYLAVFMLLGFFAYTSPSEAPHV